MKTFTIADKINFCVYCNDMHKGNCAVGKGKNHPALTQPQWISVKERLPEDISDVLILSKEKKSCVGYYRSSDNDWNMYNPCCSFHMELHGVTHWMPLPKPPEKADD